MSQELLNVANDSVIGGFNTEKGRAQRRRGMRYWHSYNTKPSKLTVNAHDTNKKDSKTLDLYYATASTIPKGPSAIWVRSWPLFEISIFIVSRFDCCCCHQYHIAFTLRQEVAHPLE